MARIACDLSDILTATKGVLVANGLGTSDQVYMTVEPEEALLGGETDPRIGLSFDPFLQRLDTQSCEDDPTTEVTIEGTLTIALWLREGQLDVATTDEIALTNATSGFGKYKRRVVAALSNAMLYNSDGDGLLWRTLSYLGSRKRGRWIKDKSWRRFDVMFNCNYEQTVDDTTGLLTFSDDSGRLVFGQSADFLAWA